MPLSTSRISVLRGLPPGLAGGINGSSICHSASLKSLGYGFLSITHYSINNVSATFQMRSKALRSEAIAEKIMSEIHESVKEFMSEVIANARRLSFGEIEDHVQELSSRFGELVSAGALEAIGNGYVGRTMPCDCGGCLEYQGDNRWLLTSLNGKLKLYRSYYYCKNCGSSRIPLDEQLCLEGKHQSIGVRKCMALLGMVS